MKLIGRFEEIATGTRYLDVYPIITGAATAEWIGEVVDQGGLPEREGVGVAKMPPTKLVWNTEEGLQ
ncbi:MAG: hypothetical protein WCK05_11980 [Planctomycetota bacterium]